MDSTSATPLSYQMPLSKSFAFPNTRMDLYDFKNSGSLFSKKSSLSDIFNTANEFKMALHFLLEDNFQGLKNWSYYFS
jgi:hypothetical protein